MKVIYFALVHLLLWTSSVSFAAPEHSKIEILSKVNSDQTLTLEFKVTPNDGYKLTPEAPWKLIVTDAKDLVLLNEKGEFVILGLDEKIPGLALISNKFTQKEAKGKLNYMVKAFLCTKDKTNCYPEVFKGEYNWHYKAQ